MTCCVLFVSRNFVIKKNTKAGECLMFPCMKIVWIIAFVLHISFPLAFDIYHSCTLMIRLVKILKNKLKPSKVGTIFFFYSEVLKVMGRDVKFIGLLFFLIWKKNFANLLRSVSKVLSNESNAKCNFLFSSVKQKKTAKETPEIYCCFQYTYRTTTFNSCNLQLDP